MNFVVVGLSTEHTNGLICIDFIYLVLQRGLIGRAQLLLA